MKTKQKKKDYKHKHCAKNRDCLIKLIEHFSITILLQDGASFDHRV